jgi:hypothetical protein
MEHQHHTGPPERHSSKGCLFWVIMGPTLALCALFSRGCGCPHLEVREAPAPSQVDNDPEPVQPQFPEDPNATEPTPLTQKQFKQLQDYVRAHKAWEERHKQ